MERRKFVGVRTVPFRILTIRLFFFLFFNFSEESSLRESSPLDRSSLFSSRFKSHRSEIKL